MSAAARDPGGEGGETLIELLVTIVILGLAGVAVMAGLELSVKTSDLGRKQANGGSYVRSLAEAIQDAANTSGGYKSCAAANAYLSSAVKNAAGLPAGYTATQTAAVVYNGTAWASCGTDDGSQRLTLNVTSPGAGSHQASESLTVIIRKPCSGSLPSPC
ncbi:type II secretion system protein [Nocardioides jejuensis]|uniref:Type II secretion system protein n=1 Tax=Nocardioides jejuensis TaxID=2502782 RepID=A0A4R1CL82_9ACTN|nr:type II secretion system protein [Nocardioides jejuensis]TCJ31215.1 type II secretion system protein [Nocardioides jejuensis]